MSENNHEIQATRSHIESRQPERQSSIQASSIINRLLWGILGTTVLLGPLLIPGVDMQVLFLILVISGLGVYIILLLLGMLQTILHRSNKRNRKAR